MELLNLDKSSNTSTGQSYIVDDIGIFSPKISKNELSTRGLVIVAGIKDIKGAPVSDTVIDSNDNETKALSGFKEVNQGIRINIYSQFR